MKLTIDKQSITITRRTPRGDPFSNLAPSPDELKFERKHRLLTFNDDHSGDYMSLDCDFPTEFKIEFFDVDFIWAKQLRAGEIYVKTKTRRKM